MYAAMWDCQHQVDDAEQALHRAWAAEEVPPEGEARTDEREKAWGE